VCSNVAAITSEAAAELYGLQVLEHNIQDNADGDITRFIMLTRCALHTGLGNERFQKLRIKDFLLSACSQLWLIGQIR